MRFLMNKKGQGVVEYAILVAVIVAIVFLASTPMKSAVNSAFTKTIAAVNNVSV